MTSLTNGIYRIKTQTGEFASGMAIQMREGLGRPMRITTAGNWGHGGEFRTLTNEQIAKLTEYGLHENQSVADRSI